MKNLLLLISCLLVSCITVAQNHISPDDNRLKRIDSVLNRILKDQHVPGFSVAIVSGDKVIYSKGFGYRDLENNKPVTPTTLFQIASCSKAFTAGLMGLLQKEGRLSFEDKVISHLPALSFYNDNMNRNITLRDLMCHRSGFKDNTWSWRIFVTPDRMNLLKRIKFMEPGAEIRQKYIYSNYGYFIQGVVAEKISRKTWEENIEERFFKPLEMKRSTTSLDKLKTDTNASLGYHLQGDFVNKRMEYENIAAMAPAGGIISTANDMANWLRMWINNGNFNNLEVLPASYVREAISSQTVADPEYPTRFSDIYIGNYGLGWGITSYRGHYTVVHTGGMEGFACRVGFFPADKLGIVVLTNGRHTSATYVAFSAIADQLLDIKPIDWNGIVVKSRQAARRQTNAVKPIDIVEVPKTRPSYPFKNYTGKYYNPEYDTVYVSLERDSLYGKFGTEKVLLVHKDRDVFVTRGIDFKDVTFRFNAREKIEDFTIPFDTGKEPKIFRYYSK